MIVIDTELSGLDPLKDSLLSIGAVELEHPENQFYGECRIWDGAHIHAEALAINGISREEATSMRKQSEAELVRSFLAWAYSIHEMTLVFHNTLTDYSFLRSATQRAGENWSFAYRTIDSHTLTVAHILQAGKEIPRKNNHSDVNLAYAARYVGIPKEPEPHNALNGAKVCAEVTSRILYNSPLLPEFRDFPIPWLN